LSRDTSSTLKSILRYRMLPVLFGLTQNTHICGCCHDQRSNIPGRVRACDAKAWAHSSPGERARQILPLVVVGTGRDPPPLTVSCHGHVSAVPDAGRNKWLRMNGKLKL
jgi:hypothetical protein